MITITSSILFWVYMAIFLSFFFCWGWSFAEGSLVLAAIGLIGSFVTGICFVLVDWETRCYEIALEDYADAKNELAEAREELANSNLDSLTIQVKLTPLIKDSLKWADALNEVANSCRVTPTGITVCR